MVRPAVYFSARSLQKTTELPGHLLVTDLYWADCHLALTQCHSGRQMAAAYENLTTREITPHTIHTCLTNQGVLTCIHQMDGKIPEILFLYNNTNLKALCNTMKCKNNNLAQFAKNLNFTIRNCSFILQLI